MRRSSTIPLLRHVRAQWLASPYPMVVHRDAERRLCICPAPSMWMGARTLAARLRDAGADPGDTIAYRGPPGAGWIQTLVAALRIGAGFIPIPHASARWSVDVHGAVSPAVGMHAGGPGVWVERDDAWVWCDAHRLLEDARDDAQDALVEGSPVVVPEPWWDHHVFTRRLMPALVAGAELHREAVTLPPTAAKTPKPTGPTAPAASVPRSLP